MYNSGVDILTYYCGSAGLPSPVSRDARSCLDQIADADLSLVTRDVFELMIGFEHRDLGWFSSTPGNELGYRLEHQMFNVYICEGTRWHDEACYPDFQPHRGCEKRGNGDDVVFVFDLALHQQAAAALNNLDWKQSLKLLLAVEAYRVTLDKAGRMVGDNAGSLFAQMQSGDVSGWI